MNGGSNKSSPIIRGYFAPSGAIVNVKDPASNSSFQMEEVYLVRGDNHNSPANTLRRFKYETVEYVYYRSNIVGFNNADLDRTMELL